MKDFDFNDNAKQSVFDEINKIRENAGLSTLTEDDKTRMSTRQEGGNGFSVGETINLTGEVSVQVVMNAEGRGGNTYFAAHTTDGRFLSLRQLIRPNLSGYKFEGTFTEDNGKEGKAREEATYTAESISDFEVNDIDFFECPTRNVMEFYAAVKAGKITLPTSVTLVAKGCRPIIAGSDVNTGSLSYKKGAKRVMRINVWSI